MSKYLTGSFCILINISLRILRIVFCEITITDKIIVIDNGKINGVGTHDELMKTNTIYQEVYQSQVKGGEDKLLPPCSI